jgi:hypothetical protein
MDSPDTNIALQDPSASPAQTDVQPPAPAQPSAPAQPPSQAQPPAQEKPSVWRAVVDGALKGLAGSAGATSFGAGLAGGAAGVLKDQQLQKQNALAQQQQQNENQAASDAHTKAAVDVAHTQAMIAQVQRATLNMPENHQQAIIDGRADQTEQMRRLGAMIPVGAEDASPDHHVALQQVTALTQQNPGKLYSAEPVRGKDGKITFQAMQVTDAPLSEDVPLLDLNGNKVGIIPKGTQGTQAAKLQIAALTQGISDLGAKAKADTLKAQAAMVKAGAAKTAANAKGNPAALVPDALGFQPKLPVTGAEGYQKVAGSFKKNIDDLSQTEQSFQQFADIKKQIDEGKDLTGAQSIVGLFNAIGISAEPLKGKGFRINNLTVAEHAGARGIQQAIEQKFGKLKTGEIITPNQLRDYADIAAGVRENKYVALVNQMHNAGLNADQALPTGNSQKADPGTARIFLRLVGWNGGPPTPQQKQAAQAAMQKKGWSF